MKRYIFPLFMGVIFVAGCVDIPNFDRAPKIDYNGIDQYTVLKADGSNEREKVTITIDFQDGDGDLGVSPDQRDTVKYGDWGNYELVTMTKQPDGTWTESIKSVDKYKWLPELKVDGKPGPIKGKLDLTFDYLYQNSKLPVTHKFKVRIRDRGFNVSNQIETDTVVVPDYF